MKTRGIIGKRIVAIRQRKFFSSHLGTMDNTILEIELNDGTLLRPLVGEQDGSYSVDFVVVRGIAKPDVFREGCVDEAYMVEVKPDAPKCKHGLHECEKCGQRRTDATHKTVRGKGVVGRIKR